MSIETLRLQVQTAVCFNLKMKSISMRRGSIWIYVDILLAVRVEGCIWLLTIWHERSSFQKPELY